MLEVQKTRSDIDDKMYINRMRSWYNNQHKGKKMIKSQDELNTCNDGKRKSDVRFKPRSRSARSLRKAKDSQGKIGNN